MGGGYSLESQMQGPVIPISLFGDAASVGAQLGQAIPSPITSIVQGGIKGVQTGLSIAGQVQGLQAGGLENQIRQNQVSQLPVQNQIQGQQLRQQTSQADIMANRVENLPSENQILGAQAALAQNQVGQLGTSNAQQDAALKTQQAQATIASLQAETASTTQETNTKLATQTASNELAQAQGQANVIDLGSKVRGIIQGGNADATKATLFDPKYAPYWGTQEGQATYSTLAKSLWSQGKLSDSEQGAVMSNIYSAAQMRYMAMLQRGSPEARKTQTKIDEALGTAPVTSVKDSADQYAGRSLTDAEFLSYPMYPTGQYGYDRKTRKVKLNEKGDDYESHDVSAGKNATYDVFNPQAEYIGTIPAAEANKLGEARRAAAGIGLNVPIIPHFQAPKKQAAPPGVPDNSAAGQLLHQNLLGAAPTLPTKALEGTMADIQSRAQNASPEVRDTVNSILQQKQAQNAQALQGTSTPSPTLPAPHLYGGSLHGASYEVPVPGVKNDRVQSVVDTVKNHPLLKNQPPLIQAVAAVESGGKASATSPTGVKGLLQVTKATAALYGLDRNDPKENVLAGKLYLNDLQQEFGSSELALAAYNAGPGAIMQAVKLTGSNNFSDVLMGLNYLRRDNPSFMSQAKFNEVSQYPRKVLAYLQHFRQAPVTDTTTDTVQV